ncbi:hypothetical protein PGTUg99_026942 [Puccinia graminis f. sp. tritici]|uniref:Uncharacterized protein n=1 Tax=Puccinia graminis f. sp. tritici TaxID=56615 RepID=A0A5B0RIP9_PUCGR|nr:hypothetical protein PGTUg99_026942 [Puccinia graminis f. sp. tritici]
MVGPPMEDSQTTDRHTLQGDLKAMDHRRSASQNARYDARSVFGWANDSWGPRMDCRRASFEQSQLMLQTRNKFFIQEKTAQARVQAASVRLREGADQGAGTQPARPGGQSFYLLDPVLALAHASPIQTV